MKERPILMSAPMVRAVLAGTKTQTRRVVKPQPIELPDFNRGRLSYCVRGSTYRAFNPSVHDPRSPYGQPGDRLWVRETWRHTARSVEEARALTEDIMSGTAVDWRATYIDCCIKQLGFTREEAEMAEHFETWRPSIHMPRWASRINLKITGIRVERLQDISEADAKAEGCRVPEIIYPDEPRSSYSYVEQYRLLWESLNGFGSWATNPWVWVIDFQEVDHG